MNLETLEHQLCENIINIAAHRLTELNRTCTVEKQAVKALVDLVHNLTYTPRIFDGPRTLFESCSKTLIESFASIESKTVNILSQLD